jgi:hypothetical protein
MRGGLRIREWGTAVGEVAVYAFFWAGQRDLVHPVVYEGHLFFVKWWGVHYLISNYKGKLTANRIVLKYLELYYHGSSGGSCLRIG